MFALHYEQILRRFRTVRRHALLRQLNQPRRNLCFPYKRTCQMIELRKAFCAKFVSKC